MRSADMTKESHDRKAVIKNLLNKKLLQHTIARNVNNKNSSTSESHEPTEKENGTGNQTKKRKRSEVDSAKMKVSKGDESRNNLKEAGNKAWHDVIYRIMHSQPRSDVLEIVKCKFGLPQCKLAVEYFDESFMQNPLRKLRLQIGCSRSSGLDLFIPKIHHHRHSLRVLDLSRNRLSSDDIVSLCVALGFVNETENKNTRNSYKELEYVTENSATDFTINKVDAFSSNSSTSNTIDSKSSKSGSVNFESRESNMERFQSKELQSDHVVESHLSSLQTAPTHSSQTKEISTSLQLLDVSYNTSLGNDAVLYLMRVLRNCPSLRALQVKCTGVNDFGAVEIAELLRSWPVPRVTHRIWEEAPTSSQDKVFINLNENCIGAIGTVVLGKRIPSYISLTLSKQHITQSTITASSSSRSGAFSNVNKCKT